METTKNVIQGKDTGSGGQTKPRDIPVKYGKRIKHYNTSKMPRRPAFWTTPIIQLGSKILLSKVERTVNIDEATKTMKPPFLLLCNHMQFFDFAVIARAFKRWKICNVVAVDAFSVSRWLINQIGSIPKRKFVSSPVIVKQIRHALVNLKVIAALYPEARYTVSGTTAIIPVSVAKMAKILKVPVVTAIFRGHHLRKPSWGINGNIRNVPLRCDIKNILTVEDIERNDWQSLDKIIQDAFKYNEYDYQRENNILIKEDRRAEGLEKILYKCTKCGKEFDMKGIGSVLKCGNCGSEFQLLENGELSGCQFKTIPEWFEWERDEVRKEIERGEYSYIENSMRCWSLPDLKKFIYIGEVNFVHNREGLRIDGRYRGEDFSISRKSAEQYSIQVEFDLSYLKGVDIFAINTENDTYYIAPKNPQVIQKISFAVEEMYKIETGS